MLLAVLRLIGKTKLFSTDRPTLPVSSSVLPLIICFLSPLLPFTFTKWLHMCALLLLILLALVFSSSATICGNLYETLPSSPAHSFINISLHLSTPHSLSSFIHLVERDDRLLVQSGDIERVPALPLQDGIFQLGVLTQVSVHCGDASYLSARDGQLGNGEGPHTWGETRNGTY